MHESVLAWVAAQTNGRHFWNVLEVGSYDENGSVRDLFPVGASYTGTDMRDGPGVDLALSGHDLTMVWPEPTFDCVVSTETLEHDSAFWRTLQQISAVLKPGGLLLLTMRGNGFPHHAYPHDYFRFMPDSAPLLLDLADCEAIDVREDPQMPGLFIAGKRR